MAKLYFDFDQISNKLRKKLVQGSVIPRPIAWITTLNEDGSVNLAPFSYFNMFSETTLGISFQKNGLEHKDSYENLIREKQAILHIPHLEVLEAMDLSSIPLAKNDSELTRLHLKTSSSNKVETPQLEIAKISMEVKFIEEIAIKDYDNQRDEAALVLVKVIAIWVDESIFDQEKQYILADKLNPIARLAGPHYAKIIPIDYQRKY